MASTFNLLTAGAQFNKSRFSKDMELFEVSTSPGVTDPQKKERKSKDKGKGKAKAKDTPLPSSLNFFGDRSAAPKSAAAASDSEDSDDESDASSVSIPEPPKQKITLTGPNPLPISLSTDLPSLFAADAESPLRKPLLRALAASNIHSLWGVQCAVSGSLLAGHDTMCIAPTGSGKTLSYLLPTLVRLRRPARRLGDDGKGIRALVLVPTHDLAVQIHGVLKAITSGQKWRCMVLSKATQKAVCESAPGHAGAGSDDEGDEEESEDGESDGLGIDVLVATPERLHHLLDAGRVSLAG